MKYRREIDGLRALVGRAYDDAFARARGLKIHVLAQVPHQLHTPQSVYYAATREGPQQVRARSVSRSQYLRQTAPADAVFASATQPGGAIAYHHITSAVCDAQVCPIGTATESFYFDDDHLSLVGAARLDPVAQSILAMPQ